MAYKQTRPAVPWWESDYPDRPPPSIQMTVTSAGAPWQAEGEVCGIPFYYRSRHGRWMLHSTLNGIYVTRANGSPEIWGVPEVLRLILDTEPWKSAYTELL